MDPILATVIVVCIFGAIIFFFFRVFRGRGKIQLDTKFGKLKAEGENPPLPGSVAAGVRIKDAEAGRDIRAQSASSGGVDLEKVKAKGDIDATHSPGTAPPKP